jgi:nuclease S1
VRRLLQVAAVVGFGLGFLPSRALGWEAEGHRVVAILAQAQLTPRAAAAVKNLLAARSMADVALWADDIKASARPETRPWHYVLIPDASPTFDDQRDCPNRACVVDKIVDFEAVLKNSHAPRDQRAEALKFLIHYLADLHQPIHCEDHHDTLSHAIAAEYPKLGHTDFHRVWDTGVVETDMGMRDVATYAAQLEAQTGAHRAGWGIGTPADWANESHHIAQKIYAELGNPPAGATLELTSEYGSAHAAIVEGQLERAGVRLAAILNRALVAPSG